MSVRIYLAGPDVFLRDAAEVGRRKQEICREFGFEGLFPLDQDEATGADPASIFRANCALMRQADIGLFNLTPFRGPSADPGTVFELGFLFALGKPVHGYSSATSIYRERVATAMGPLVSESGRCWDHAGHSVEDFGLADNLMIVRAILDSGGDIAVVKEEGRLSLAAYQAFKACLEVIAGRIERAGLKGATRPKGEG